MYIRKAALVIALTILAGCCTAPPPRSQWVFDRTDGLAQPPPGSCGREAYATPLDKYLVPVLGGFNDYSSAQHSWPAPPK